MISRKDKGFKGTVYFASSLKSDFIYPCLHKPSDADGYVLVGQCEVDVQFVDARAAEIEAYERLIAEEKQASHNRVQLMLGKIQELQALECKA